jgi:hypothetical protein
MDPETVNKLNSLGISPEMLRAVFNRSNTKGPKPPRADGPSAANLAVANCLKAYSEALQTAVNQLASNYDATKAAALAYRESMPPLCGQNNIRDFIACVSHAMLIQVIDTTDGTKLLYAAQIAYGARENRPHRARKDSTETPVNDEKDAPKPPVNVALEPLESAQVS